MKKASKFSILDLLFPRRCLSCRAWIRTGDLCDPCEQEWPLCEGNLTNNKYCERVMATALYQGIPHDLIVRMKYQGEERLAKYLGQRMALKMQEFSRSYDMILPIPLHLNRLRERGYNQALLLARSLGREVSIPVDPFLLRKTKETVPQALLKGEERRKNLDHNFELSVVEKIEGKSLLLVDDVYTTGTTIEMAAKVLHKAGASKVEALVVARVV